ncbi:MAG: fibronectin type III domain-containing protein [Opitutaceae bacterium]
MLSSTANVDLFVNNFIVPFVIKYRDYPCLWSIDLCNEPDYFVEQALCGGLTWDMLEYYFAKASQAIHENSNILVTVGISMGHKYNNPAAGHLNVVGDTTLQTIIPSDPNVHMDFFSPHHYDWKSAYWGNPAYMTPTTYGIDGSKPTILGECPSKGTIGHTITQDIENAFINGWQGLLGWSSNDVDNNGNYGNLAPGTTAFYNNHTALAYPDANVPAAPTSLTATAANTRVKLSWTASTNATWYNVYRGLAPGNESTIATGITGTAYTNTGLTNGTTYYYKVKAANDNGESAFSNEASAAPANTLPEAPTGLAAAPGSTSTSATLSWVASPDAANGYNIYRGTSAGGESTTAVGTTTGTTYTNTGLSNGQTYFYKVKAVNGLGAGSYSTEASVRVGPPVAPTNLAATSGYTQVALKWDAAANVSYNVYRGTSAGGESTTPINGTTLINPAIPYDTTVTYTDTGLALGTYYYKVKAVNTSGLLVGPYSNEASAASALVVPPAPGNLSGTPGNAQVVLTWDTSNTATSYNVYRGLYSGSVTTLVTSGIATTTYTNTGLANGTTYYFKVSATNATGTGSYSNIACSTPYADNAQYNFETDAQSWTSSGGMITNVSRSTTGQKYAGTASLAVTINCATPGGENRYARIMSPADIAPGATITYHVWIPSGTPITGVQPYVKQGAAGGWTWTGTYKSIGTLTLNAWNTITVTVPANAVVPLDSLGVSFVTNSTCDPVICYIDAVTQ